MVLRRIILFGASFAQIFPRVWSCSSFLTRLSLVQTGAQTLQTVRLCEHWAILIATHVKTLSFFFLLATLVLSKCGVQLGMPRMKRGNPPGSLLSPPVLFNCVPQSRKFSLTAVFNQKFCCTKPFYVTGKERQRDVPP